MSSSCSLSDQVQAYSKVYEAWVTGEVTHVYDNGDLQVVGLDNWEGVVMRCSPDKVKVIHKVDDTIS